MLKDVLMPVRSAQHVSFVNTSVALIELLQNCSRQINVKAAFSLVSAMLTKLCHRVADATIGQIKHIIKKYDPRACFKTTHRVLDVIPLNINCLKWRLL